MVWPFSSTENTTTPAHQENMSRPANRQQEFSGQQGSKI
jgi:hypothetical protein